VWYTGAGDQGKTKIPSKGQVWKDDPLLEALGDLDELNSVLGIVGSAYPPLFDIVKRVQDDVFVISSELAGFDMGFSEERTKWLEEKIAEFAREVEPPRAFVLPGGHIASAYLQFARAVARRAERRLVALLREGLTKPSHESYMNRLSSLLFLLALYVNKKEGVKNVLWKGKLGPQTEP
jgi:cob(I)alamin adenosyltransferase